MYKNFFIPIVFGLFIIFFSIFNMNWTPVFTLDDAYIVQHSVHNILSLQGETRFLDSAKNSGLTSPLHVVLVAVFSIFMGVDWGQFFVASFFYLLFLVMVFLYSQKLNDNLIISFIIVFISGLSGFIVEQTYNGLETIFAISFIMLSLYLSKYVDNKYKFIVYGFLPFIRPELFFLSLFLFILDIFDLYKKQEFKKVKINSVCFLITVILLCVFEIYMTGSIIPSTASAKKYFFADACNSDTFEKIKIILRSFDSFLSSLGWLYLCIFGVLLTRYKYLLLAFLFVFYFSSYQNLVGAGYHNAFRYQFIFYPFVILGLIEFINRLKSEKGKIIILALILSCLLANLEYYVEKFKYSINFTREQNFSTLDWVSKNIPSNAIILIHDAGVISLLGKNKLVDLVGLKTIPAVEINKSTRWASCRNNSKSISMIADRYKAQYFVVLTAWDNTFQLTNSLREEGWKVNRIDNERGETAYKVYSIQH